MTAGHSGDGGKPPQSLCCVLLRAVYLPKSTLVHLALIQLDAH